MKLRLGIGILVLGGCVLVGRLPLAAQKEPRFSIECQDLSAAEFSRLLSRELGLSWVYLPRDPQTKLNFDLKSLSRAEIQTVLSRSGTVAVASREVRPETALSAVRVSLQATHARTEQVGEVLRRLSQERFVFIPHSPSQVVSLDCEQVTFFQLAGILASFGKTGLRAKP
jgi:hypothetical protein